MGRIINFALQVLRGYLRFKGNITGINTYLENKAIQKSSNCRNIDRKNIKIAAIQVEVQLMNSPVQYCKYMYNMTKTAVVEGAQLIVFPESNGLQLLGMIPGISVISRLVGPKRKSNGSRNLTAPRDQSGVGAIMKVIGPAIENIYKEVFSQLAGRFGVYIMGGSIIAPGADGKLYNTAYLFGPDGQVVGQQDKLHLMPAEAGWGVQCGYDINVFETTLGKIAFPICMDATYFETFRIVERLGAEIVLVPIANPEDYNHWLALRGIWARVQETTIYGVKSALVGEFLGQSFTGRSGIFCPVDLMDGLDGVIVEAETYNRAEVVVGEIDLEKLRRFRMEAERLGDINRKLYEKYTPGIYGQSSRHMI